MPFIKIIPEKEFIVGGWGDSKLKIITHSGLFHADEVFSIALLVMNGKPAEILRTRNARIIDEFRNRKDVFILDVGGAYNPEFACFDHHSKDDFLQNEAAVSLLFNYLNRDKRREQDEIVYKRLILGLKNWDTGNSDYDTDGIPLNVSQIISSYNMLNSVNQDQQFALAVRLAIRVLKNEYRIATEILKSGEIWRNSLKINNEAIELSSHCAFWRMYNTQESRIHYILQPSERGWAVISTDAKRYPLPEITGVNAHLIFYHQNKYFALFNNKKSALDYIIEINQE